MSDPYFTVLHAQSVTLRPVVTLKSVIMGWGGFGNLQ